MSHEQFCLWLDGVLDTIYHSQSTHPFDEPKIPRSVINMIDRKLTETLGSNRQAKFANCEQDSCKLGSVIGYTIAPQSDTKSCCGHDSDCAAHNEPAFPAGPCDCSVKSKPFHETINWQNTIKREGY